MTTTQPLPFAVTGASGRMGRRIIALAANQPDRFQLIAALDAPTSAAA